MGDPSTDTAPGQQGWLLPLAVLLLCLLPLLLTPVLPSIDFYAHVVRYNILAHPAADTANYTPHWALLPNIGMDVLGTLLLSLLPPLLAAKILAGLVIVAPVAGTMRLSLALHGRISGLAALMAGLLSYNLILFWGFANFLLGFGIALWSIGWWLSREAKPRLQLAIMIPTGILLLFVHGLAFALWGLLLAALELGIAMKPGPLRLTELARRWARLLLLAVIPFFLFLQMSTTDAADGVTGSIGNLAKIASGASSITLGERLLAELLKRIDSILRVGETGWMLPDRILGALLWLGLATALLRSNLRLDRRMLPMVLLCILLVCFVPPNLFGVGHIDERMPLLLLAVLVAALAVPQRSTERRHDLLVPALALLFPLHLLFASAGMLSAGQMYRAYLEEIRHLDTGPLAASYIGSSENTGPVVRCKPLLFLLQLEKGTAVPTFANQTEQPLRLAGELAMTTSRARQIYETETRPEKAIARLLAAGFSTVVACTDGAPVKGATVAAQGPGWTIYQPERHREP